MLHLSLVLNEGILIHVVYITIILWYLVDSAFRTKWEIEPAIECSGNEIKLILPFFFQEMSPFLYCLVTKSCSTLCNPINCSPQGSTVHRISQARIQAWLAISFSRGSSLAQGSNLHLPSGQRIEPTLLLCRQIFTAGPPGNIYIQGSYCSFKYVKGILKPDLAPFLKFLR